MAGSYKLEMYGCRRASSTLIRLLGSKTSILCNKSIARGFAVGYSLCSGTLAVYGREVMYMSDLGLSMKFISSFEGVPSTLNIIFNWDKQSVPGNIALRPSNSEKMQPTDHISMAVLYTPQHKRTSGARYLLKIYDVNYH